MPQEYTLQPSPVRIGYETNRTVRGSWTPTFTFGTPGDLAIVYGAQSGFYLRIEDYVFAWFNVFMSTFTHGTANSTARIEGLPYVSLFPKTDIATGSGSCIWDGITATNYTQLVPDVTRGDTSIEFTLCGSGQSFTPLHKNHMPSGGTPSLIGHVQYIAAPYSS